MAGVKRGNLGARECAWRAWRWRKERIAFPFSLQTFHLPFSRLWQHPLPKLPPSLGLCEDPVIGLDPSSSSDENGSLLFLIAVRVFKELSPDNSQVFFSFTLVK